MIQRVFIENFKAIYRASDLPIEPFTVFIGNNGTGKSSIIDALRTLQLAVNTDLENAFKTWSGLEKIRNYNAILTQESVTETGFKKKYQPITIALSALVNASVYEYQVRINLSYEGDYYVVEHEELICNGNPVFIADAVGNKGKGVAYYYDSYFYKPEEPYDNNTNRLILAYKGSPIISDKFEEFSEYVENWQFLYLNAHTMGEPIAQNRLNRSIRLNYDGTNIADYLLWLRKQGQEYLDNLIRKLGFVLPYLNDLQPQVEESFVNMVQLQLYETKDNSPALPGWLLSSGTLRILALLAMFVTPEKPSVLFVDEIENGLDPRTIGLLLSQIESVFADKSMQVVVTTHSPYFLDLIPLESIVVAEKDKEGSTFHIPKNEESLKRWKEKFSPGKLYTMGKLTN